MKFNDIKYYHDHFYLKGDNGNEKIYLPNPDNLDHNQEIRMGNSTVLAITHNIQLPYIVVNTKDGDFFRSLDEEIKFHKVQVVIEKLVAF